MKKRVVVCALIVLVPIFVLAQSETTIDSLIIKGKQKLHQAVNVWEEQDLVAARAFFERLQTDPTYPWLIHYYIALADYRLISFCFSKKDKDKVKQYIDDGIEHLKACLELNEDFAEAHSLLSLLYGNKIGTNPLLGMTLGPKSGIEMEKAMELQSHNPRTHLIAGLSANFTPKLFGGGKKKAKIAFQKAIAYFDLFKLENPLLPDWGHEEAYAWLGRIQMEEEEFESAQVNFDKALEINPNYGWVRYVLKPELKRQMEERR